MKLELSKVRTIQALGSCNLGLQETNQRASLCKHAVHARESEHSLTLVSRVNPPLVCTHWTACSRNTCDDRDQKRGWTCCTICLRSEIDEDLTRIAFGDQVSMQKFDICFLPQIS